MLPVPLSSADCQQQHSLPLSAVWHGAQLLRPLHQLLARPAGPPLLPKQAQAAGALHGRYLVQGQTLRPHWMQASWLPPPPSPACCILACAVQNHCSQVLSNATSMWLLWQPSLSCMACFPEACSIHACHDMDSLMSRGMSQCKCVTWPA